jgi:hypothetical protein
VLAEVISGKAQPLCQYVHGFLRLSVSLN